MSWAWDTHGVLKWGDTADMLVEIVLKVVRGHPQQGVDNEGEP